VCLWCLLVVLVEIGLYLSYRGHDARFHWLTHFFVGAATALLVMSLLAWRRRCPVPYPLVLPVAAHLVAMFPDFLFTAGIAHFWWMDLFLGHISTHFVPGRNVTWYLIFLAALGLYLAVLSRLPGHLHFRRPDLAGGGRSRVIAVRSSDWQPAVEQLACSRVPVVLAAGARDPVPVCRAGPRNWHAAIPGFARWRTRRTITACR
jgi:hypothetical protein